MAPRPKAAIDPDVADGNRLRVAILAPRPSAGETGGAERFYQALSQSLRSYNLETEIIEIAAPEHDYIHIVRNYLKCSKLDLQSFDRVISTKAPTHACQHPFHICYLQHLVRAYYDMFDTVFPTMDPTASRECKFIRELDTRIFRSRRIRKVFTISDEVSRRLRKFNGVDSTVLYQGSSLTNAVASPVRRGRHMLFVSRLHPWKRPRLAIEAMLNTRSEARLVVAGRGDDSDLQTFVNEHNRLRGRVVITEGLTDEQLARLYRTAVAVIFPPIGEDFGLITLEAAQFSKPVITCCDSGEPARLVQTFSSGIICKPAPSELAGAIDFLWDNPAIAERLGHNNHNALRYFSWQHVGSVLARTLNPSRMSP